MPSAFPTWILFTCYFLNSWTWVSLGQRPSYPKPSLQVIPSNVIAKGENFTIRCQGPLEGVKFHVFRDRNPIQSQVPPGNVADFHFTNAQQQDSETYSCRYNPTSDGAVYSDASDPINIQVRDTYPKPSLQVSPGNVTLRGGTLTFTCTGERLNMRFALRWHRDQRIEEPPGMQAVFTVHDVQYEGTYDCYYQTKSGPTVYSEPSESRHIRVLDLPKASIALKLVQGVKGDYKIHCSAPKDQNVKWFFLYEDGGEAALTDRSVPPGKHNVAFPVSKGNGKTCQRCRCSYQIIESGESVLSPLSDLLSLDDDKTKKPDSTEKDDEEHDETDSTEKASDKGHGGKDEKEITPKPTNTPTTNSQHTVIISIVCIAILLIILVVATLLYRRRRSSKTKDDIQKKGLSSNEEKAEAAPESTYATIDKRKNPDNTNIPEVRESEENEDQEELTYVTVSQKSLKKKRPAQPRSDEESTVYAAVNLH